MTETFQTLIADNCFCKQINYILNNLEKCSNCKIIEKAQQMVRDAIDQQEKFGVYRGVLSEKINLICFEDLKKELGL